MQFLVDNFDAAAGRVPDDAGAVAVAGRACCALVLGTVLAAMRVSPVAPLRGLATFYVEVFRNTPLTVVFFFLDLRVCRRSTSSVGFFTGAVAAAGPLHRGVRLRGGALRHQRRAAGAGGGRPRDRPAPSARRLRERRAAAGLPHRRPAAGQRLDRDGQEHLHRRRLRGHRAQLAALPRLVNANAGDLLLVLLGVVVGYMLITLPSAYAVAPPRATGGDPAMTTPRPLRRPRPARRRRAPASGTVVGAPPGRSALIAFVLVRLAANGQLDPAALGRPVRPEQRRAPGAGRSAPGNTLRGRRRRHGAGHRGRACSWPSAGSPTTRGCGPRHRRTSSSSAAIPLLVVIFALFFVLPTFGVRAERLQRARPAAWSLYNSAVLAEIFRAGILSVDRGQREAAFGARHAQVAGHDPDAAAAGRPPDAAGADRPARRAAQGHLARLHHRLLRAAPAGPQPGGVLHAAFGNHYTFQIYVAAGADLHHRQRAAVAGSPGTSSGGPGGTRRRPRPPRSSCPPTWRWAAAEARVPPTDPAVPPGAPRTTRRPYGETDRHHGDDARRRTPHPAPRPRAACARRGAGTTHRPGPAERLPTERSSSTSRPVNSGGHRGRRRRRDSGRDSRRGRPRPERPSSPTDAAQQFVARLRAAARRLRRGRRSGVRRRPGGRSAGPPPPRPVPGGPALRRRRGGRRDLPRARRPPGQAVPPRLRPADPALARGAGSAGRTPGSCPTRTPRTAWPST